VAKLLAMESALLGLVGGAVGTLSGEGPRGPTPRSRACACRLCLNSYPACAKTPPPVDLVLSLEGCTPMIAGAFAVALLIGVSRVTSPPAGPRQLLPAEALRRVVIGCPHGDTQIAVSFSVCSESLWHLN